MKALLTRNSTLTSFTAVIALPFVLLEPCSGSPTLERNKLPKAWSNAGMLAHALKGFQMEFHFVPVGGNAEIMAALRGKNPRRIAFLEIPAAGFNAKGEFIDPWGTPYQFDLSNPEAPRVWSCGPNLIDEGGAEGSDDVVSWREYPQPK